MTKEDFNEEELILLKAIFKLADEIMGGYLGSCLWNMDRNTLYDLKQKLGIYDLVG